MSNKLYDFKSSLQTGKIGEELVLNWIINNEKIKEFQDVREVDLYRKKDIDFIVTMWDSKEYTIEVKYLTWQDIDLPYQNTSNNDSIIKSNFRVRSHKVQFIAHRMCYYYYIIGD